MISICFATNNKNKIAEVRSKVGGEISILSLEDVGCFEELPETSPTLEGNSAQKAWFVADKYKVNCFADDTGLEVDALNGEPGVYSARYAGPACNPEDNMNKLLLEMVGQNKRSAQFKTCITLIIDGKETIFHGAVKGTILTERHGKEGFGYDPIFQPEGYLDSFAQMPLSQKNTISHRALAVEKLIGYLKTI
jgi:XTP/dITP diphosphohydrolase